MSRRFPYYNRDTDRILTKAYRDLTRDEAFTYSTILDLIYHYDGDLQIADEKIIAGHCLMGLRLFRKCLSRLVELGRLSIENGIISNSYADKMLLIRRSKADKNAENRRRPNKKQGSSNHDRETTVERIKEEDRDIEEKEETNVSSKKKNPPEQFPIDFDWTPTTEQAAKLDADGWRGDALEAQRVLFIEYWRAHANRKTGKKTDRGWGAAFTNWLKNARKFEAQRKPAPERQPGEWNNQRVQSGICPDTGDWLRIDRETGKILSRKPAEAA